MSLSLAVGASILWLFGGLLVGTISGLRPGSIIDRAGMIVTLTAVSVPIFFTGPILLLLFVYTAEMVAERQLRPAHRRSAAVAQEHDPAVDRAGGCVRRALRAADPGDHDGNDE